MAAVEHPPAAHHHAAPAPPPLQPRGAAGPGQRGQSAGRLPLAAPETQRRGELPGCPSPPPPPPPPSRPLAFSS